MFSYTKSKNFKESLAFLKDFIDLLKGFIKELVGQPSNFLRNSLSPYIYIYISLRVSNIVLKDLLHTTYYI